jgi:hypothetical protein
MTGDDDHDNADKVEAKVEDNDATTMNDIDNDNDNKDEPLQQNFTSKPTWLNNGHGHQHLMNNILVGNAIAGNQRWGM